MKLKLDIDPDIVAMMAAEVAAGERAVTAAMREAGTGLKTAWRTQITGAGLGRRLANSIRNQNFPRSGESLDAAALVWSKAPIIIGAHDTGPLIRSKEGFWLAIPLPAAGKSKRGGRITPGEWERRRGLRLRFVYRRTGSSLLVAEGRLNTKGQAVVSRSKTGRGKVTAPIFLLVPQVGTTTSAGTPAALELQRFGHFNGSITRNGTALGNVVSADITYANNLDRIETIRSDGRIDGADPSIAALTGSIEVRFANQTLVTQAINGDPCELEFAYVLPSGESFTFTVHAVYLPRPRIEISGPQGVQATFDWQAARDSTVGRMCTATLINDIEVY